MPLRDVSFDTISGAGPNGAIIHYRVSRATNRQLRAGELFLLDSGAQYEDGTTDITRTIAIGAPTDEMRERATIVLKGMIGISMLRFPPGTRGCDIDAVARLAHWKAGIDYAHGTGHGVGSYLSVHEGPQRIAKTGTEKLIEGMILSNEPGYYKPGQYGIRLENLILVTAAEEIAGGDIAMHGFETLTLAPFDRRLIAPWLLTKEELSWLDAYHARVLAEIGPLVGGEPRKGRGAATAPLRRPAPGQPGGCRSEISTAPPVRNIGIMPPQNQASAPATTSEVISGMPPFIAAGATRVVSTAAGTALRPASTRGWIRSKRDRTRCPPTRAR